MVKVGFKLNLVNNQQINFLTICWPNDIAILTAKIIPGRLHAGETQRWASLSKMQQSVPGHL